MKKKNKFYTVWIGRNPGVYSNWEDCKEQVNGFEGALYKGFLTIEQAQKAFSEDSDHYIGKTSGSLPVAKSLPSSIALPIENSICVDGAWNTQTNAMEYQGVYFPNREPVFHAGPFDTGTNNIAEFLAIVHALAFCKSNALPSIIYSDSRTAILWVKKKKAATKIERTESNKYTLSLIERAETWLNNNEYSNEVLKWETDVWGENPADFGRK